MFSHILQWCLLFFLVYEFIVEMIAVRCTPPGIVELTLLSSPRLQIEVYIACPVQLMLPLYCPHFYSRNRCCVCLFAYVTLKLHGFTHETNVTCNRYYILAILIRESINVYIWTNFFSGFVWDFIMLFNVIHTILNFRKHFALCYIILLFLFVLERFRKQLISNLLLFSFQASRSISKCGYLFVAPDWDFSIPLYRTKVR